MHFTVHPAAELPIYRQIMRQVIDAIASGRLARGEQMPSHRELSEQLVIAPLTVKKAYDELEAAGYVETQRGRGTFVADRPPTAALKAQASALSDTARALLLQSRAAGVGITELIDLLRTLAHESAHPSTPVRRKDK